MTLSEYASKYGHGKLLDIGCGDKPYRGLFSSRVSQFIGLDTNKIPTKADVYGSVINIPFKEKSVDTILCVWVLDDVPEPDAIFSEVNRVLKKNGMLLLVANQSDALHFEPNDYLRFTKYATKYLAEKNYMRILEYKEIGGFWVMIGFKLITYFRKLSNKIIFFKLLRPIVFSILNILFHTMDKIHDPKYDVLGHVYVISKNKQCVGCNLPNY